jgi:hypothetical protein
MSGTLQKTIPSYLYQQYSDDEDLQAFVASYNAITQQYINTFNGLNLPIYTQLSGALLDWVGQGVYGYPRPSLPGTAATSIGPLDTYSPNAQVPLNTQTTTPGTIYITSDDVYQRLLTWHFYKGDGKVFSINWLKRRIMRFMLGTNGTAPNIPYTYQINVTFGSGNVVNITCPTYPMAPFLAAAIASGAAEMPFQWQWTFTVSGPVGGYVPWLNNSGGAVSWVNNSSGAVTWNSSS